MSNQPTAEDKIRLMSLSLEFVSTNVRNHNYVIPGIPKEPEDIITMNVASILSVYDQLLSKVIEEQSPEKKYLDYLINMFNTGQRELENHIKRPNLGFLLTITEDPLSADRQVQFHYQYIDSLTKEEIRNFVKR